MSSRKKRNGFTPSRRSVLKGGLLAAGAAAASSRFSHAYSPPVNPSYKDWLIDRITFGRSEAFEDEIEAALGENYDPEDIIDWQLGLTASDDNAAENDVAMYCPTYAMSPYEIYEAYKANVNFEISINYMGGVWLLRGWRSKRQLLHVMADFWTNVFSRNAQMTLQELSYQEYDKRVFYAENVNGVPNAIGDYHEMLLQSAKGASMNIYLNQFLSTKDEPIENYARELLELHTLGVDPRLSGSPFTEEDMAQTAKVLTGWSFKVDTTSTDLGDFVFYLQQHDLDPTKTVYGNTYNLAGDEQEGVDLLYDLATHPRTAEHMALRMIQWFVTPNPRPWLINKVKQAFLNGVGTPGSNNIANAVKVLFERATYDQLNLQERRIRRPFNLAVAMLRALDPDLLANPSQGLLATDFDGLLEYLDRMGQRPGYWPAPDGYPDEDEDWIPSIQPRLEFCDDLVNKGDDGDGKVPFIELTDAQLDHLFRSSDPPNPAQVASYILTGGTMPQFFIGPIENKLAEFKAQGLSPDVRRDALALVASSPFYQHLA